MTHGRKRRGRPSEAQILGVRSQSTKSAVLPTSQLVPERTISTARTGKPLWPIEEKPVPKSHMPGEEAWATQPFPTMPPPFARQKFTADDIDPYIADLAERARLRDTILSARNEGLFTPPGLRDTIQIPGNNGGGKWGGAAVGPTRGMLYAESKDAPSMLRLEPKPPKRQMTTSAATQAKLI